MRLACFICDGPDPKMEFIVDRVSPTNGCWGFCKLCGIAVCTGHGRRHENPDEYQCAICVGPRMRRGGPGGGDPTGPTTPDITPEEFINAYGDLKVKILDAMHQAIEEYFDHRGSQGHFSRKTMDRGAREAASAAYSRASGADSFMASIRRAARELAENA
jgi:hypothetical protein